MRIAVVSDIHGNFPALQAVLADISAYGADLTVNLGDLVSGPVAPAETMALLRETGLPTLSGNHERSLATHAAVELAPVDQFVRARLSDDDLAWMAELPKTAVVADEVFLCHGTPRDDNKPWLDAWFDDKRCIRLPDEAAVTVEAEGFDHPVLLCGHTHVPRAVRLRDGRLIVNPGSVGLQMHYGSPDARYAVIERTGHNWTATFRAVPYDHDGAAATAAANGFPRWAAALAAGWQDARGLF